jgi:hypothetical protein
MARGYNRRRSQAFEHTRAICYHIAAVNRDPKKSFPTMQKYWPLPTDEDSEPDEQTEYKRLKSLLNNYKQGKLQKNG